jgi:hypothetical protein
MLLAESFVLLALDPDGTPAQGHGNQEAVRVGVTGALITELCQQGHLRLDDGRLHVTGTTPEHPLLRQVLENVAPHDGKSLKSRLGRVKHSGWREVVDMMIADGKLGREAAPLRATRHPVRCLEEHEMVLRRVRAAASSNEPMDDRTAVLLALALPCHLVPVVAPDRPGRTFATKRMEEAVDRVPAAAAVKYVVEAAELAIMAAATAGVLASN